MKRTKSIAVIVAALFSAGASIETCHAQEFYKVIVSATGTTTNPAGALKTQRFGNKEIIKQCADEDGITNSSDLSLVYNRGADALQVIQGTNHTIVCTPLSFSGGVSLSSSNGTRVERLTYVYTETNTAAAGTLAASEFFKFGSSNQVTAFHLVGRLQFATSGDTNNAAVIYQGAIVAGPVSFHGPVCGNNGHNGHDGDGNDGHGSNFKTGKSRKD